ncbi:29 kDa ribonucleoprotein, chloroplastic-like isoform X2 [Arachis stenosperma]|uniref:29 kDa ribonucleoprotein, chloroplastic-like isoform X2 n=1 Tax=Arachis stenosperma TaxID=217475 RepID=UPI0025AD0A79|nr:29 kDa ribonucleoprotein, chloroplastic-like isoform X2 [Arachis stenosperma]
MAATRIASSLFSSSINTTVKNCFASKTIIDPPLIAISSNRKLSSLTQCYYFVEPLSLIGVTKLWTPKTSAAVVVSQEEIALSDDAGLVEEEKERQVLGEQQQDDSAESSVNTKLYFGNLPYSVDSAQLAGLIESYGSAELIEVLYDRDTGKSRGFAFVTMSCIEDCNAVIQNLDGKEFLGRTLRVNFADKPKPKEPLYPETEHKLFVGNLSWSVTSESLTETFQEYGTVVGARVLYDGETGRSRGYGFVCYSTKAEMEAALTSLNDVELEGRAMRVSVAQGKRSQG